MDKSTKFPQYRKLNNEKHFYKIIDSRTFEEIQLIGTKIKKYTIEATQYPEMVRIMDMLNCEPPFVLADEKEWKNFENC